MKKVKKAGAKVTRLRTNLTLSPLARELGQVLADGRGIALSQLVEQLVRTELRRVGKLPPEGGE